MNQAIQDRINHELDGLYQDLDFYATAWGGDPDENSMAITQEKIDILNAQLKTGVKND